jgi:PAS domain S-box-containing protein
MTSPSTILLVNSAVTDRATYRQWLNRDTQPTFTFLEANCGSTALEVCQQEIPALILLDDRLPDMDSLEFLARLKQRTIRQQIPVVIVSEREDITTAVQAMKQGAQDYLVKPKLTSATLCRAVQEAIAGQPTNTLPQTRMQLSEEQQRLAIDLTHIGTWDWQITTGQVTWSDSHFRLLGLVPNEADICYETWRDRVHPEDLEWVEQLITAALNDRTNYEAEYRMVHPDGSVHWIASRGQGLYDDADRPVRMVGIIMDISDRKRVEDERQQAEALLRHSEATNRAIIQAIPDLLIRMTRSGDCLDIISCRTIKGAYPKCAIQDGETFIALFPDFKKQKLHYVQRALETGELQIYEQEIQIGATTKFEEVRIIPTELDEVLIIVRDITERKQIEIALQTSEARFHAFMNNSPTASWITDNNGQILYVSQTYYQTFNLLVENPIGKTVFELYSAEIAQQFFDSNWWVAETGQVTEIVENVPKRDGTMGKFLVYKFPLEGVAEQRLIGGVAVDITKRLQAEQALRQLNQELEHRVEQRTAALQASEAVLQAIFNQVAVGINLTDFTGRYLKVNQACCDIVGYTSEELLQTDFIQITHPEDQGKSLHERQRLFAGEINSLSLEKRYIRKDGLCVWAHITLSAVYKTSGEVDYAICVVEDITQRKQAEAQLRQQLDLEILVATITQRIRESLDLPTILNTTVAAVQQLLQADRVLVYHLLADGSGQTIAESRNPICQPMLELGFSSEVFPPEGYQRYLQGHIYILPDRSQEQVIPCIAEFMQTFDIQAKLVAPIVHQGTLWGLLIVHQCSAPRQWQDWEVRLLQQLANQLAIATKQSELYQQLQSELQERKQTQQLLEQANHYLRVSNLELARATRHKDEFLANMSHELRTPLNAILGMSEALLEEICGPLTERQQKAIATIAKSGTHLLELINDILDLAKIEAGKLDLQITPVAIAALCDSSLTFVRSMADKKGIQLTAEISANVDQIEADDRRLQQVLINLLSNAVKFTPAGGSVKLEAWIEEDAAIQRHGDAGTAFSPHVPPSPTPILHLSVSDTGIGIAQSDFDLIFRPFRQIDSSLSRQYNGTGLGLALVRRIIEMHQGIIVVESKLGQGSRFTIRLPVNQQ